MTELQRCHKSILFFAILSASPWLDLWRHIGLFVWTTYVAEIAAICRAIRFRFVGSLANGTGLIDRRRIVHRDRVDLSERVFSLKINVFLGCCMLFAVARFADATNAPAEPSPTSASIPIDHFVYINQENISFD